jgi:hypothetical protein
MNFDRTATAPTELLNIPNGPMCKSIEHMLARVKGKVYAVMQEHHGQHNRLARMILGRPRFSFISSILFSRRYRSGGVYLTVALVFMVQFLRRAAVLWALLLLSTASLLREQCSRPPALFCQSFSLRLKATLQVVITISNEYVQVGEFNKIQSQTSTSSDSIFQDREGRARVPSSLRGCSVTAVSKCSSSPVPPKFDESMALVREASTADRSKIRSDFMKVFCDRFNGKMYWRTA